MKVRTLIASTDTVYTGYISEYISENYADTMEINVAGSAGQLSDALGSKRYDVALIEEDLYGDACLSNVKLPVVFRTNSSEYTADIIADTARVLNKHRRISLIVADILEQYASVTGKTDNTYKCKGGITAVWSPGGGTGSTTVALAFAAANAAEEKKVFYLSLESFVSTHTYFRRHEKSISTVFEMLEGKEGSAELLVRGIHNTEDGIMYLCAPDNFDDICILSQDNINQLITCCSAMTDELIVDLSCVCDMRTRLVFELADRILLVSNCTESSKEKLSQFISQSNIYESIRDKTTLIVNNNTLKTREEKRLSEAVSMPDNIPERVVYMPFINCADAKSVYKALAGCCFDGKNNRRTL